MKPTKPSDFRVSEAFGDMLFNSGVTGDIYYLNIEETSGEPDHIAERIAIKKICAPYQARIKTGDFSGGEYHIVLTVNGIDLICDEIGSTWSFDKADIMKYIRKDFILRNAALNDETRSER